MWTMLVVMMMTMVITMMMMIAKVMSLPYMGFLLSESGFIPAPGGELPTLLYSVSFLTCTPIKSKSVSLTNLTAMSQGGSKVILT